MLSVVLLNVIMQNIIMLSIISPRVVRVSFLGDNIIITLGSVKSHQGSIS
jgi:hypothetical protein